MPSDSDWNRDEEIVLAYHEGSHSITAIARELGLAVSRVSKTIAGMEAEAKDGI